MGQGREAIILTLRFACELGMLAGLALWGAWAGDGPTAWLLGVGAPVLAATVWGAFVAPKAKWPVPIRVRLLIELALFGWAAVGLFLAEHAASAAVLAAVATVTSIDHAAAESREAA